MTQRYFDHEDLAMLKQVLDVLQSKLAIPSLRPGLIPRVGLVNRLADSSDARGIFEDDRRCRVNANNYVILAYVLGLGLLWGYAARLWLVMRSTRRSGRGLNQCAVERGAGQ